MVKYLHSKYETASVVPNIHVRMLGILAMLAVILVLEGEDKRILNSLVSQHSQIGKPVSENKVDRHPEKQVLTSSLTMITMSLKTHLH